MSSNDRHLSIVIPAHNEAQRILPTLKTLDAFLSKQPYSAEVIVVDDFSTDKTREIVAGFIIDKKNFSLIAHPRNLGKGAAVKTGMELARGQYRLFSDADLSTPIEEINGFFPLIEKKTGGTRPFDVVIGSRRVAGATLVKRQPFYREISGRIFSVLVRLFVLDGFLDTQCGFKLFTAAAAEAVFPKLTINRFGFDVEALFIATKVLGLRVKEAPVKWIDSPQSQVRLRRDAGRMFLDLFRIRKNHARRLY